MKTNALILLIFIVMKSWSLHSQTIHDSTDQDLITKLEQIDLMYIGTYNPKIMINTSNELMELPKETILDSVLHVYNESESLHFGYSLCLLLQITFDVVDSIDHPSVHWGRTIITAPQYSNSKFHFPLLDVKGYPILLPVRYDLFGLPPNSIELIEFYRKYGIVRSKKYELECNCTFEELQISMASAWKEAYSGDMSQYHEEWYIDQLKMIAKE